MLMKNDTLGWITTGVAVLALIGVIWVLMAVRTLPECPTIPPCPVSEPVVITETITEEVEAHKLTVIKQLQIRS